MFYSSVFIHTRSISMGNSSSIDHILDEEALDTYTELTYLRKNEIRRIIHLLDEVEPGKLRDNLHHRFSVEQIEVILPQIRCNPFRDTIYRTFSSQKDGRMSLEDVLDMCSVFSKNCPRDVRAAWAFHVFDFDGDNEISVGDLMEAVRRLTRYDRNEREAIDTPDAEHVAKMVLREMVFNQLGTISPEEFLHFVSRISEFSSTLTFKI